MLVDVGTLTKKQPAGPLLKCAEKTFTDAEIAQIVAKARASRSDLPPPPANPDVRVHRSGCNYELLENPKRDHMHHFALFTIDMFGELSDVMHGG